MTKESHVVQNISGLDLIEEAAYLLRTLPIKVLFTYYLGSIPFIWGLLHFWTDMSRNANAHQHSPSQAVFIAFLFLWMKCWHTVFANQLSQFKQGALSSSLSGCQLVRLAGNQIIIQSTGLIILPFTLLLIVPFGTVYAFYQNVTMLDTGQRRSVRDLMKKALHHARLWPKQNHLIIWLLNPWFLFVIAFLFILIAPFITFHHQTFYVFLFLLAVLLFLFLILICPLGAVITVNIGLLIYLLPHLLRVLFGLETIYTMSGQYVLNTTFIAIISGITYLCLDPVVKAVYFLRCFYGESIQTGQDLMLDLRRFKKAASIFIFVSLLWSCSTYTGLAAANTTKNRDMPLKSQDITSDVSVSPVQIENSIQKVLQKDEFAWRFPRETLDQNGDTSLGLVTSIMRAIVTTVKGWMKSGEKWLNKVRQWLNKLIEPFFRDRVTSKRSAFNWQRTSFQVLITLFALIASMLAILLYRIWRQGRLSILRDKLTQAIPVVDIEDDTITADKLPEDEWIELSQELLARGDYRLSIRALYFGILSFLSSRELITIVPSKSDRDFEREVHGRSHQWPETKTAFSEVVTVFEQVWYGAYAATEETISLFHHLRERIKTSVRT